MTDIDLAALKDVLYRGDALHERLHELVEDAEVSGAGRDELALNMCWIALEHAGALRELIAGGMPISAVSLLRLQFEAVTRALWLMYAALDSAIAKLQAPLTLEAEQAAKDIPGVNEMIQQIKNKGHAPLAVHQMLSQFKAQSWNAMNSFVHSGIHPLRRASDGFPPSLAVQVLRNSNGLSTMTGMAMAILIRDGAAADSVRAIQSEFADCLPDLITSL
ncbi:hypothetical protein [Pandoraea capi]|uniref:DUF6988 family protein n=1 Tax=Pandoraea TaxID=93217 RepID=UPI001F5D3555|nr:hypothetical protein [Pandoraea capi]